MPIIQQIESGALLLPLDLYKERKETSKMTAISPFETCDFILRHLRTSCLNFAIKETCLHDHQEVLLPKALEDMQLLTIPPASQLSPNL